MDDWLKRPNTQEIDPDLQLFSGEQHNTDSNNFRFFLDSCSDRWGRLLMKRRDSNNLDGEFLDNDERLAAPPISSLRELE